MFSNLSTPTAMVVVRVSQQPWLWCGFPADDLIVYQKTDTKGCQAFQQLGYIALHASATIRELFWGSTI